MRRRAEGNVALFGCCQKGDIKPEIGCCVGTRRIWSRHYLRHSESDRVPDSAKLVAAAAVCRPDHRAGQGSVRPSQTSCRSTLKLGQRVSCPTVNLGQVCSMVGHAEESCDCVVSRVADVYVLLCSGQADVNSGPSYCWSYCCSFSEWLTQTQCHGPLTVDKISMERKRKIKRERRECMGPYGRPSRLSGERRARSS